MEVCLPNKVCLKVWLERALEMLRNGGNMIQFGWELTELPYLEEKKHIRPWPKHMETTHNIQKTYQKHTGSNYQWKRIYSDFILFFFMDFFECKTYFFAKNICGNIQKTYRKRNPKPEQIYSIFPDFSRFNQRKNIFLCRKHMRKHTENKTLTKTYIFRFFSIFLDFSRFFWAWQHQTLIKTYCHHPKHNIKITKNIWQPGLETSGTAQGLHQ